MWAATKFGFFSIVQKDGAFHVRARVRADLVELRRRARLKAELEEWPAADYRWRVRVGAAELARVFRAMERSVDYGNFKNEIARTPGQVDKLRAYHDLWGELHRLQLAEEAPDGRFRAEDHAG